MLRACSSSCETATSSFAAGVSNVRKTTLPHLRHFRLSGTCPSKNSSLPHVMQTIVVTAPLGSDPDRAPAPGSTCASRRRPPPAPSRAMNTQDLDSTDRLARDISRHLREELPTGFSATGATPAVRDALLAAERRNEERIARVRAVLALAYFVVVLAVWGCGAGRGPPRAR